MPRLNHLKRQKGRIIKTRDGLYKILSPQIKGLVLSGGGAKVIAYSGMLMALHEQDYIKQITHVSGASAGAITASLIAIGLAPNDFKLMASTINLFNLLDREGGLLSRAKGQRLAHVLDLIYYVRMRELLNLCQVPPLDNLSNTYSFYSNLENKCKVYTTVLSRQNLEIDTLEEIIAIIQSPQKLKQVEQAFRGFHLPFLPNSPHFTFGDLEQIKSILPRENQHLIKDLCISVTNQTKGCIEQFNTSTPHQPLAIAVQWSCAHPLLFNPQKNARGEYVADGGILDNMPEIEALSAEESLCVKIEPNASIHKRMQQARRLLPESISIFNHFIEQLFEFTIGGKWLSAIATTLNKEKIYHWLGNMLYINSGEITTTSIHVTKAQKDIAIQNGYLQTKALLKARLKSFEHPLLALIYLDQESLTQFGEQNNDEALCSIINCAEAIHTLQETAINAIEHEHYIELKSALSQIEELIDLPKTLKKNAMGIALNQINFMSDGKLHEYLSQEAEKERQNQAPGFATRLLTLLVEFMRLFIPFIRPIAHKRPPLDPALFSSSRLLGQFSFLKDAASPPLNENTTHAFSI